MMTPAEIQNKRFEKGMSGYKTEEVHAFLIQVADYVKGFDREREEMIRKMEILAEKIEEYKEDEESLRAALIGAQKLGDSVVRESKRKAEAILNDAVQKAQEMTKDAQQKLDSEAFELEKMRSEVASFKANLIKLYQNHLRLIDVMPDTERTAEPPKIKYTPPAELTSKTAPDETPAEESKEKTPVKVASDTIEIKGKLITNVVEDKKAAEPAKEAEGSAEETELKEEDLAGKRPPRTLLRYDKLNQFFGEENPVKREE